MPQVLDRTTTKHVRLKHHLMLLVTTLGHLDELPSTGLNPPHHVSHADRVDFEGHMPLATMPGEQEPLGCLRTQQVRRDGRVGVAVAIRLNQTEDKVVWHFVAIKLSPTKFALAGLHKKMIAGGEGKFSSKDCNVHV